MQIERVRIAERFRGPPRSGNGGYVCGLIARHLYGPSAVRLKAPPPLDAELRIESTAQEARLYQDEALIGEAKTASLALEPPPAPSYEQAQVATRSFLGLHNHPFPGCFVCGTQRETHDGLRSFPGQVPGEAVIAAPGTPEVNLADEFGKVKWEFLWSALDCPGAFAVMPLPEGVSVVLGELCASIVGEVRAEERCVVTAWRLGGEGRKRFAGSAVYGSDGRLVALARAVWIEVPSIAWD
ncbi:MAG TPA: hypothetical protein VHK24_14855 [Steroidobacter sp.]|nr:hypothetical protein [Steroidobacter sp.]